jgi:hypothetical protein
VLDDVGRLGSTFHPAEAVDKGLDGTAWGMVILAHAVEEAEPLAKLGMHPLRTVAGYVQTTALGWSLGAEAGHDYVTVRANGVAGLGNIAGPVPPVGEEVKDGPGRATRRKPLPAASHRGRLQ